MITLSLFGGLRGASCSCVLFYFVFWRPGILWKPGCHEQDAYCFASISHDSYISSQKKGSVRSSFDIKTMCPHETPESAGRCIAAVQRQYMFKRLWFTRKNRPLSFLSSLRQPNEFLFHLFHESRCRLSVAEKVAQLLIYDILING